MWKLISPFDEKFKVTFVQVFTGIPAIKDIPEI